MDPEQASKGGAPDSRQHHAAGGVEKNEALAYATDEGTKPQRSEFEHRGADVVVLYTPPSVSQINEVRNRHVSESIQGRTRKVRLDSFEMELDLLNACIRGSNIPRIPEDGKDALRDLQDWQLWQKLLKACEIVERTEPDQDDLVAAAEAVVDELLGEGYTSVKRLYNALEGPDQEEDIKKSSRGESPTTPG